LSIFKCLLFSNNLCFSIFFFLLLFGLLGLSGGSLGFCVSLSLKFGSFFFGLCLGSFGSGGCLLLLVFEFLLLIFELLFLSISNCQFFSQAFNLIFEFENKTL
jgi:hypothetical protein